MKYYIITGEASGDLHASKLMTGLKKRDPQAEFRCWGGEKMEAAGGVIVKHYRDLAFMGFTEVLANLGTILRNIRFCKQDILQWHPDAVILVDYPDFNMRIAGFAKKHGFKVFYYIAPQVWAWRKYRVHKVHRNTDLAFVVMPFEVDFHRKYGYHVEFTGHPLPDSVDFQANVDEKAFRKENGLGEKPIIALLPGSRRQELRRMLRHMLKIVNRLPEYQFVIAGVNTLGKDFYAEFIKDLPVKVLMGRTYDLLKVSHAAAVTSGTATLETGFMRVPQVVCYRFTFVSALLAWLLVHVEYISLVNIILGRRSVTELIQYKFTAASLERELRPLLPDGEIRSRMLMDYDELLLKAGTPGASDRAAGIMAEKLGLEPI